MIGVGKEDARAQFLERFMCQSLNCCGGTHRHERWGFNLSVRCSEASAAGAGRIGLLYFKRKIHLRSLAAAAIKTLPTPLCPKPKRPTGRIRSGRRPPV